MSILFLSTMDGAPWGGSEELWFEAALRTADKGLPVEAAVLKWAKPAAKLATLRERNIRVHEYGAPSAPARLLHKAYPSLKYAWLPKRQPRFVVLSQGGNWSVRTIEIAEVLAQHGIPYVIVSQCAYPWYWPADPIAVRMRAAFDRAKASYFVSRANLELSRLQVGGQIPNGSVVRNPFVVDYDQILPWPEGDSFRLACIARLEPGIKGHDLLFEVLADGVWRNRDLQVTLYGAGPNPEITRHLQQRFQLQNVAFGGFLTPPEIWRKNHGLILTSRAEGLPIVLVEAMLCGRPGIVTDAGGNCEVLEDGVTGFVAGAVNPSGIGEALERAWQQRDRWKTMGEHAAITIREMVPRDPAADFAGSIQGMIP